MFLLLSAPASADLLYDNGPINGHSAYGINFGFEVSNSFNLSSASNLTQAQIGLWTQFRGDVPISVDWSIGTDKFLSDKGSGTANLTNTLINNYYGYGVFESTFPLSGTLAAGTYWLTLRNAVSISSVVNMGEPLYWDSSNGPSQAYQNNGVLVRSLENDLFPGSNSESFQIHGTAVPEPGTMLLLGSGLIGLLGIRRKIKR